MPESLTSKEKVRVDGELNPGDIDAPRLVLVRKIGSHGRPVGDFAYVAYWATDDDPSEQDANAEFLARAVNSYDGHVAEIERLTGCLAKANAEFEKYERLYYLEKQKNENGSSPEPQPAASNAMTTEHATLSQCPFCERPADSEGGIWHVPNCEGLEDAGINKLQYRLLTSRAADEPEVRPTAWMRGHHNYHPGEPDDYDVECVYGDEPPDDSGKWVPLYRRPSEPPSDALQQLRVQFDDFVATNKGSVLTDLMAIVDEVCGPSPTKSASECPECRGIALKPGGSIVHAATCSRDAVETGGSHGTC